jgi:hypothetical protein
MERAMIEERLNQTPTYDPDIQEITDAFGGRFLLGTRPTLTGALGWTLGSALDGLVNDDPSDPLNFAKSKDEATFQDPLSYGLDNNVDGIAADLEPVPFSEWSWILSANTYGEYKKRLGFVKAGLPVGQAEASGWGYAFGLTGDIAALTAIGMAAEPIALAGLGARGALAGRAGASSLGVMRTQSIAAAAAEAATTVGRMNLTARYAALGVAEEAVYQAVRAGVDPIYEPTMGEVVRDMVISGTIAGVLGGAVFGRTFVKDTIQESVEGLRRQRITELPGGYTIQYGPRIAFDSPAAADQMLFAKGTGSFADESERVGRELFTDWNRDPTVIDPNFPGTRADLTVPGTRTVRIGETPVAPAPREVGAPPIAAPTQPPTIRPRRGQLERVGLRSAIKAAAFELSLAGVRLNEQVFAGIARALVRTELAGLSAGAFNKRFWEEVAKEIPGVALRKTNERAFIPGIDRTVRDLVEREDMVNSIWSLYRRNALTGVDTRDSLIFRVLSEIRARGGTVNRDTVAEVVDTLREVSQRPPTKLSKNGKRIVDKNGRRLAVAQLVNKFAKSDQQVFIPNSLLNKMQGGRVSGPVGAGARAMPTGAVSPDFNDIPKDYGILKYWSWFGNQSARLLQSDNGAARAIGWLAFGAKRTFDIAQPQTIFEAGSMALHGLMFTFLRGYRNGYTRFVMGDVTDTPSIMARLKEFGRKEMRAQFHDRVIKQMRTGNFDDASASVNDTARGFRELLNKIHQMAHEVGLKGFQTSAVNNYMPRMWRWDRIRRLATTESGKKALIRLIRDSLDQNGRKVVIDGVEQTFKGDLDEAATVFANRLIGIANKTENAPLIEQEQELAEALLGLAGPVKGKAPAGGTPFGRVRTLLNEDTKMSTADDFLGTGRMEISIADLTNNDLPFVMRKYITSIVGAMNQRRLISAFNDQLRARGVFSPKYVSPSGEVLQDQVEVETVEEMIALAKKIGGEIGAGQEEGLRELVSAIRYEPIHMGPTNVGQRVLGIMLQYGYLTTGGQFGLAALGELSRIVGTLGIGKTLRQMPVLLEMIDNWKNMDRDGQNLASLVDAWFAPSTDRLRRVFLEITPTDEYGGALGFVERRLNSASQILSDISGLAPVTSFTQQLTAATTLQHLFDVARKGTSRLDNATVRALGLEPEQYEQIIEFVGRNAKTKAGWMGERIVGMDNIDAKDMDLIKAFVQRMVESRIQSVPTRGDFHKSVFSILGRVLTQFRTFNLKGVDNFLIQNATRVGRGGGAKVAQEIGATLMFAGTIQYLRTYADWKSQVAANDWEAAEQTEERLGIPGFIRGAFTGPSEFFVPSLLTDTASTFLTGDPIFSPYRYSGLSFYGFPGEAQTIRAGQVIKDLYGAAVGKPLDLKTERDITTGTIRKARLLLPFQNLPILKQYFNILEAEIEEAYNLPSQQPRRKRD